MCARYPSFCRTATTVGGNSSQPQSQGVCWQQQAGTQCQNSWSFGWLTNVVPVQSIHRAKHRVTLLKHNTGLLRKTRQAVEMSP